MSETRELQRSVLDLFAHVDEPLSQRAPHQASIPGMLPDSKDLAETGERLRPRLTGIGLLPRGRIFAGFRRAHMEEAMRVVRLLMSFTDNRDLRLAMSFLRDNINEEMFVYAVSVLALHQPQFRGVNLPPIEEVIPQKFVPSEFVTRAVNQERRAPAESTEPIVLSMDFSGNDLNIEHRLSYWREDVGLNTHHWHWHIVYPFTWDPSMGGTRDRKGELFYYMHQQMLGRYDCERLSHNLSRVTSFHNFDDPIPEGYAPHLSKDISGTVYASRPVNMVLQDLPIMPVQRLRTWHNRIINAIHQGSYLKPDGTRDTFNEATGINVLGAIIEASAESPHFVFYGDFHNEGHNLICRVHDPDERFREEIGVMGDPATAMRDPIFFRWHKFIDLIFQELKNTLTPYTPEQLTWSDVTVQTVSLKGAISERPNNLQTFWQERQFDLQRGINFNRPTPVSVRTRHLQHEQFSYSIVVQNGATAVRTGTVRIFMAPARNEIRQPFVLNEQRHVFIEMDKFEAKLNPGANTIARQSSASSVTLSPGGKTFGQLIEESQGPENPTPEQVSACTCGLPDHLLVPRGKPEGMEFQLFVMITDAEQDRVPSTGTTPSPCRDAASYCGILNEPYPDRKAMGFPFDRRVEDGRQSLNDFKTPNMGFTTVTIRFRNELVDTSGRSVLFPIS